MEDESRERFMLRTGAKPFFGGQQQKQLEITIADKHYKSLLELPDKLKNHLNNIVKEFNDRPVDKCEAKFMREVGYSGCAKDILRFIKEVKDE